jgi:hypothetical protein
MLSRDPPERLLFQRGRAPVGGRGLAEGRFASNGEPADSGRRGRHSVAACDGPFRPEDDIYNLRRLVSQRSSFWHGGDVDPLSPAPELTRAYRAWYPHRPDSGLPGLVKPQRAAPLREALRGMPGVVCSDAHIQQRFY